MTWLRGLDRPSPTELKRSILPKPAGFTGSTFETDISNIRLTGDARFIETAAALLQPLLDLENDELTNPHARPPPPRYRTQPEMNL